MTVSSELYERATRLAGLGIWEHNLDTGEFYLNDIARDILEITPDFTPDPAAFLDRYEETELINHAADEVMRTGRPEMLITRLLVPQGEGKWVRLNMQGIREQYRCIRLFGTIEDITSSHSLRMRLEEREQRFAQAFTNAPIGMAIVSISGKWIKVNTSLCELLGYSEEAFLQHTFQEFTYPEDLDIDLAYVDQLLTGKIRTYRLEKRYLHKDGHIIWALLNVSLIRDAEGKPVYFVSQIKDITQQKQHAETIRSQNERLLHFAHIVSHNLRSHTGNIKALSDLALAEAEAPGAESLLQLLSGSATRLLETISDLNNIVAIQDKQDIDKHPIALHAMVERVREVLSAQIRKEQATLNNCVPESLDLYFNPAYLESILVNLISNSLRYRHKERAPVINVRVKDTGENIELAVSDNGVGIDLDRYGDKLFGMYKTFHGHPDAKGIGLFLVKTQAEAMNSTVNVESTPQQGSTFTISIPKKSA